jgi:anti-sigma B factor antagonist
VALVLGSLVAGSNLGGVITFPPAFRVDVGEDPGTVVLALQGEADLATAPLLAQTLAQVSEDGSAPVVLDAARLEFIDACCLGVIANARALLRGQGRDLVVRSPGPLFRRVLSILEMEDLIELQANQP